MKVQEANCTAHSAMMRTRARIGNPTTNPQRITINITRWSRYQLAECHLQRLINKQGPVYYAEAELDAFRDPKAQPQLIRTIEMEISVEQQDIHNRKEMEDWDITTTTEEHRAATPRLAQEHARIKKKIKKMNSKQQ
jgi:hypothetical protein